MPSRYEFPQATYHRICYVNLYYYLISSPSVSPSFSCLLPVPPESPAFLLLWHKKGKNKSPLLLSIRSPAALHLRISSTALMPPTSPPNRQRCLLPANDAGALHRGRRRRAPPRSAVVALPRGCRCPRPRTPPRTPPSVAAAAILPTGLVEH